MVPFLVGFLIVFYRKSVIEILDAKFWHTIWYDHGNSFSGECFKIPGPLDSICVTDNNLIGEHFCFCLRRRHVGNSGRLINLQRSSKTMITTNFWPLESDKKLRDQPTLGYFNSATVIPAGFFLTIGFCFGDLFCSDDTLLCIDSCKCDCVEHNSFILLSIWFTLSSIV
jgi:hypothetical protein